MEQGRRPFLSSVGKKQVVATTALLLSLFIVAHLGGNIYLFLGPEAFNDYAKKLEGLGPLFWLLRAGLAATFLVHISFTLWVTADNWSARERRYAVKRDLGGTSFAKKTMIYTGILTFFYLLFHLSDFTLGNKTGPQSVVEGMAEGESLYLYGLVYNAFGNPGRVLFYILAVCGVGLHLSHGIQSFIQTFGFFHPRYTPAIRKLSIAAGAVLALGFISIPIYFLIRNWTMASGG